MKTSKYIQLLLCSALLLVACQKAPVLSITGPTNIELSADGSSGTITFTANRDWTISTSDSWVSVSPSRGEAADGQVTVTVRCGANTTYEDRTATVTIKMEELTQTVSVRQPANLGIVLPTQSYNLESDGRTINVEVQANVQYTVSTSVDWIKQTGTKGLTSTTFIFSVEENQTYDAREGTITIKSQNSSVADQVITVKQAQKDALIVKDKSFDMPYGGGEIEFKVEANVDFDVKPDVDWIHYLETKALSNSTVRLSVDENSTYEAREGKIEIKQKNGTLSHTITVKEAGRIAVTSITLDQTSIKLKEGETANLVATIKPDNATDKTVTWISSDEAIAVVDANGTVTAVKEGTVTITAQAGEKKATCEVTVKNEVLVSSLDLDKSTLSLVAGQQVTLVATVGPEDATDKTVIWSSTNEQVATVDDKGKVTAIGKGHADILALSGTIGDYCTVFVKAKDYGVPSGGVDLGLSVVWSEKNYGASSPSDVGGYYLWGDPTGTGKIGSFNPPTINSISGTEYDIARKNLGIGWRLPTREEISELFSYCGYGASSYNGVNGVEFTGPSDKKMFIPLSGMGFPKDGPAGSYSVMSADKGFMMTGDSYTDAGGHFVYVYSFEHGANYNWSSYNASYAIFPVRPVYEKLEEDIPVTSISLNKTNLQLTIGNSETLVATIYPSNATETTVTWSSSNASIATVDVNGRVTAIEEGTATITARVGEQSASCSVVVQKESIKVTSITLNKTSINLAIGSSETLIATLDPSNATETVHWGSSNPDVASVDASGKVTAVKEGSSTITAMAGEKSATCAVTVRGNDVPVTEIILSKTSLELTEGDTETLTATVLPDNATDKIVSWWSSDINIVIIDAHGVVTARKEGTATIKAKIGAISATCSVTVKKKEIVIPKGAVDLGIVMTRIDGTKYNLFWAECNIGANKPEDYGDYYAWGEVETKEDYSWIAYKWADGSETKLTKYCPVKWEQYWVGSGAPDEKLILDPEDDVAHVKLGGKWRMPTKEELDALRDQCIWTWAEINGIKGYMIKSKANSNSIFLPAAGRKQGASSSPGLSGSFCLYWSSNVPQNSFPYYADYLDAYYTSYSKNVTMSVIARSIGSTIRPVTE